MIILDGGYFVMFIEGLRRAKKKWRIGVGVLLGLIIISLVLSFAFFGSSIGVSETPQATDILEAAELNAEAKADAVKDAEGDMTVIGDAAAAYLSLAAYQDLYLHDSADAYKEALDFAQQMVAACGSTEAADYNTAYSYVMEANFGLGDAAALSAAFNESLALVTIDESYINSYYQMMSALNALEQFSTDMDAVKAILEPQVEDADAPAEGEEAVAEGEEDNETPGETGTPAAVLEYVDELLTSAKLELDTAE